jgi:hypothetical protein
MQGRKHMATKSNLVPIMRTCNADMTSYGGFVWPRKGLVTCPDWESTYKCGHGLHGLLNGAGDGSLLDWSDDAFWLVVMVESSAILSGKGDLVDKCKFPTGTVVFCGKRDKAIAKMVKLGADPTKIVGSTATAGYRGTATAGYNGTATAGDRGTATVGDNGTATAGDYGTATAGYRGTATAGYNGTATAGYNGTATAGDCGTATAGYRGTATAGYNGTATAGDRGTATVGDNGTATAGDRGTATAGYNGTATAGYRGTATAGDCGTLNIRYWDGNRYRTAISYVGEDKIKPNTPYRLNGDHKAVKA